MERNVIFITFNGKAHLRGKKILRQVDAGVLVSLIWGVGGSG